MKWRALAVALTAMTITSSFGVISGTLAWFAYTTRASLSFDGTTVNNSEQLQIGLKFETDSTAINAFETTLSDSGLDLDSTFEIVTEGSFTYYFVMPGAPLSSNLVSAYSKAYGHATNELIPVTSREYTLNPDLTKNSDLTLNRAPTKGEPNLGQTASSDSYSYLHLAFRVLHSGYGEVSSTYMKNRDIWLKDVSTSASLTLENSLRLFCDSDTGRFILNPKAESKGSTTVAGLLNLDYGDDYYDYDPSTYFYEPKELIYGDYTLKDGQEDNARLFDEDSELSDVNNTGSNVPSSFLAKHQKGIKGYDNLDNFDLKKADYLSMSDIKPSDSAGYLSDGHVICRTSDTENAIASLAITIYLEGWDHSITNEALDQQENTGLGFDLGLTFQTNRVD